MRWTERGIGIYSLPLVFVYSSFLLAVPLAVASAVFNFSTHSPLLGVWSILSIVLIPKAVLGLVLLAGRADAVWLEMSRLVCRVFPRTIKEHRNKGPLIGTGFGPPVWLAYLTELTLLGIGLYPVIDWAMLKVMG